MFLHRNGNRKLDTINIPKDKKPLSTTSTANSDGRTVMQHTQTLDSGDTLATRVKTQQPRRRGPAAGSSMVFLPCGTVIKSTPCSPPPTVKFNRATRQLLASSAALVKTLGPRGVSRDVYVDGDDDERRPVDTATAVVANDQPHKCVVRVGTYAERASVAIRPHDSDSNDDDEDLDDDEDEDNDVYEDTEHVLPRLESKTALTLYLSRISEASRLAHLDSIRSHRKKFLAARRFFDANCLKPKPFQIVRFDLSTSTTTATSHGTIVPASSLDSAAVVQAKKPSTGRGWVRAVRSRVKRLYGGSAAHVATDAAAASSSSSQQPPWKGTLTPVHRSRKAPIYFVRC